MASELEIRACARKRKLYFSRHAQERMKERGITVDDVYTAVERGEVVEVQPPRNPGEDGKILFQEDCPDNPTYYISVASCDPPTVVTACTILDEEWEIIQQRAQRRARQ